MSNDSLAVWVCEVEILLPALEAGGEVSDRELDAAIAAKAMELRAKGRGR